MKWHTEDFTVEHESTGADQLQEIDTTVEWNSKEAPWSGKRKQITQSIVDSQTKYYNKKMKVMMWQ